MYCTNACAELRRTDWSVASDTIQYDGASLAMLEMAVCSSEISGKNNALGNALRVTVDHGATPLFEYKGVQPAHSGVCLGHTVHTWVKLIVFAVL